MSRGIPADPATLVSTLITGRRHLPTHASALERYARRLGQPDEARALGEAYERMTPAKGSPRRVFQSLEGTPHLAPLLRRLRTAAPPVAAAS